MTTGTAIATDVVMEDKQDEDDVDHLSAAFVAQWIRQHTPSEMHASLAQAIQEECIDGETAWRF